MTAVAVLGASGGIGKRVIARLLARSHEVIGQTRSAGKLAEFGGRVEEVVFDPAERSGYGAFLRRAEAVVFALGVRTLGGTTLFSDATRALLAGMASAGTRRLVAITGVGAGETRGHGGFVYNRILFPLVTRRMYADKDRQERLIAESGLDWTIVRPAPFSGRQPVGPLRVHTGIPDGLQLRAIGRDEVADFIVAEIETPRHTHERPFIGHA